MGVAASALFAEDPLAVLKDARPREGTTTISANTLEFDYKDFVALFDGNVRVEDPQFTLSADKLLVFFDKTNEVRRLDAIGNVKVISDDRTGTCGKAVYTRATGSIVLQYNPVVSKAENTLSGDIITVWLNDSRVDVEGNVKLEGVAGTGSDIKQVLEGTMGGEAKQPEEVKEGEKKEEAKQP